MPITQPYFRTCRQFTDGHYAHGGNVEDSRFAKHGEHYVRALALIQKDLLDLFDFIEPDHKNKDAYSYRAHLHIRNYAELLELRQSVGERLKDMRDTGITQLRATIAEQADLLGVELKDLIPKKTRKRRSREDDSA